MANENIHKLAILLVFAFIVPAIGYLAGVMWSNSVAKIFGVPPNPKLRKLAVTFFLGLPVFTLATFVRFDYEDLWAWWNQSRYGVSILGLVLLVFLPGLLIRAIVKVWRPNPNR